MVSSGRLAGIETSSFPPPAAGKKTKLSFTVGDRWGQKAEVQEATRWSRLEKEELGWRIN